MFDSQQKSTGIQYTTTAALLILAFIFSPALLIMSRPFGYVSVLLAIAFSALCTTAAWVSWIKYSQVSIPSIESLDARRDDPATRMP